MKKLKSLIMFVAMFMLLGGFNVYAATVGDQLLQPEAGWQRYDVRNPLVTLEGTDWVDNNGYDMFTLDVNAKIKFKFKGTKIRIIGLSYNNRDDQLISIDGGIPEQYSNYNGSAKFKTLIYEKTGLDNTVHNVEITSVNNYTYFGIERIDIDEDGSLIDPTSLESPSNLISSSGDGQVSLTWNAVDNAVNYNIKRATISSGPYTEIATGITNSNYIDTTVTNNSTYYYVVTAVGEGNESPNSNEVSATPLIDAQEATYTENLIPAMTSATSPEGVVTASSYYKAKYEPYLAFNHKGSTDGGYWCTELYVLEGWLAYEFIEPKIIAKYTITQDFSGSGYTTTNLRHPKNWTFEGWNEATSQWDVLDTRTDITGWVVNVKKEFVFDNQTPYKKYRINITANNGDTLLTSLGELEMMAKVVPNTPTNLIASVGEGQISLTWNTVENIDSYTVKRSTTSGGPYTTIATDIVDINYIDTTVISNTTYYYIINAVSTGTESYNSDEVSATTPIVLEAPTNLMATPGDGQVSLTWNTVDNVDSYTVKRATTTTGPFITLATDITDINYTDTIITNGTTYYYVVTAVNTEIESDNSNVISATPKKLVENRALLIITLSNGIEKDYDMSQSEITSFINWYDNSTTENNYYIINKPISSDISDQYNIGPMVTRKEYIIFNKIECFDVIDYIVE